MIEIKYWKKGSVIKFYNYLLLKKFFLFFYVDIYLFYGGKNEKKLNNLNEV